MHPAYDPTPAAETVGGHPVLDFVNTVGGRTKQRDADRLTDYAAWLAWTEGAGVIDASDAAALTATAQRAAARALVDVKTLRETLHRTLAAVAGGRDWAETDRQAVEAAIHEARSRAHLLRSGSAFAWQATAAGDPALPLLRICLAADDLLTREDLSRLRECERCSWLFLDRGRGRPRRWCSMATCGNRAKAARYQERRRRGDAGPEGA